jgi:hypothetical protein
VSVQPHLRLPLFLAAAWGRARVSMISRAFQTSLTGPLPRPFEGGNRMPRGGTWRRRISEVLHLEATPAQHRAQLADCLWSGRSGAGGCQEPTASYLTLCGRRCPPIDARDPPFWAGHRLEVDHEADAQIWAF